MKMWKWLTPASPEPQRPTSKTEYPYGTCVETESGRWFIRDKVRFRIPTDRILESWSFNIIPSTDAAVSHYKIAGKLGFRDGTLIQNIADGKIYMIAASKKRHVVNPDFLEKILLNRVPLTRVSNDEAWLHSDGEVLN